MTADGEGEQGDRLTWGWNSQPSARGFGRHTIGQSSQTALAQPLSPLHTFSNSLKDVRKNADALLLTAKNSSSVQRIKHDFDEWESKLRQEAKAIVSRAKKLPGPISPALGLEDWDLLRGLGAQPQASRGLRKSASENGLNRLGYGQRSPAARKAKGSAAVPREWDLWAPGTQQQGIAERKPLFRVSTTFTLEDQVGSLGRDSGWCTGCGSLQPQRVGSANNRGSRGLC